jgi:outer membrane protein OmpA-like peptidoglycan-associated protein
MKTEAYLPDAFTLEFDFIFKKGADGGYGYQPQVEFYYMHEGGYENSFIVGFGQNEVKIEELFKSYPPELKKDFNDKWHHAALVFKNGQMKAYVDQYRTCVNPNIDKKLLHIVFDGIGDESKPIIFTNVRLAEGGGMNLIGKKFTDSKIVTHGITFDVNKATIKPESMGTLNMIAQLMKENPDLKFEVGGHTDSDGGDADNLKLSQARADAVKTQLTNMGVAAERLTSKGYGETKPIADNTTPEGKANNRRVEFVKTSG